MRDTPLRNVEQFGTVLRLKRKEKGLSQSALADLLGVERKWVIRLEAGNPKAEFGLVLRALKALGIHSLLRDEERADMSAKPSRIDEVFGRLQRYKK